MESNIEANTNSRVSLNDMSTAGANAAMALVTEKTAGITAMSDPHAAAELIQRVKELPVGTSDASSRHARKVYVGNLPLNCNDVALMTFFNQTLDNLLKAKPAGTSIVDTYINSERRFAFLEHRCIEEAMFTISLDGLNFCGSTLRLRRPQDFNPPLFEAQLQREISDRGYSLLGNATDPTADTFAYISSSVEDGPNKVFIGGLPHNMTEAELKQLLQAFGPLKALHLVKDPEHMSNSKGFGFCEWRNPGVTEVAVTTLNGMRFGTRTLTVRRALVTGTTTGANILSAFNNTGVGRVSRIMSVTNMVPVNKYDDAAEVQRVIQEASEECAKIGEVRTCRFVCPNVLIEFASTQSTTQAVALFQGRQYDGRVLRSSFSEATQQMKLEAIMRIKDEAETMYHKTRGGDASNVPNERR